MAHEEWRDVVGYENYYQVSSGGVVRSVDRSVRLRCDPSTRLIKGKVLKLKERTREAPVANLNKDGVRTPYHVDELVANAFIGKAPSDEMSLIHINGDMQDCSVSNLKWVVNTDELDGEEWRDVVGYENLYQVSSIGRVRSVTRVGTRVDGSKYPIKGCQIKRRTGKCGYETVLLHKNSDVAPMRVDVLVASAFISEGTDDQFVHHINGDVGDSRVENIRWISKDDYSELILGNNVDEDSEEEWRDISGYKRYQISSYGRVKRLARTVTARDGSTRHLGELIMRQAVNNDGRLMVMLRSDDGKYKSFQVHRLVANAFIENECNFEQVDHINGIRTDNRVTNLRWCDRIENARHRVEFGNKRRLSDICVDESQVIDEIEGEEWCDVIGTDGAYQISNAGRVRSVDRFVNAAKGSKRMVRGRIIKPHTLKSGYVVVHMSKRTAYIHRLVAQAFIPNPDSLPCVDHIDGNKGNNRVENLRWCTNKENTIYAIENGLFNPSETYKAFHATEAGRRLEERLRQARSRPVIRDDGVEYPSVKAAADAIGYNSSSINDVLMGRAKKCDGHSYKYADGGTTNVIEGRRRQVCQIDPATNEVVATYPSRSEAVMAMDNTGIGNCLRGAAKTSAGFKWKYADEV